jgi:hypothetical protein
MNFQFYLEKLKDSQEFKNFEKENNDLVFSSGFFVVDKQGQDNKQHFDFFVPGKNKLFSFQLENNIKRVPVEFGESKFEKIPYDLDFDFNDIENLIIEEMQKQGIKNKIQKFLFSLQNKDGKSFLIGTIFISGLGLVKISIDLKEMKILDFKKKSFFDMLKITSKKKEEKNGN